MRTIAEIDIQIEQLKLERENIRINERNQMKEFERQHQWTVPRKLQHMAYRYPNVSWLQANQLYSIAVDCVLSENNIEVLSDLPFGKGLMEVRIKFENLLDATSMGGDR